MRNKFMYRLRSGKNNKLLYYSANYARMLVPKLLFRNRLKSTLSQISSHPARDYILARINYYCKLAPGAVLSGDVVRIGDMKPRRQKVYFFDTYQYTRWFDDSFYIGFCPGDVTYVPDEPSIVKSRPLTVDNTNSVVLKLDKVRHFIFVNDKKMFEDKQPRAIFRGKVYTKPQRVDFMNKFFEHPMFDAADVGRDAHPQWIREKLTIGEHLDFRFIMALEGNDVASNLKWVMSSNSLAVMPEPSCETWFMEGKLLPDVHYVRVKPDFSDLVERIEYYNTHIKEANEILSNAHQYVGQFRDKEREKLISLGVLYKYFRCTGQMEQLIDEF